MTKLTAYEVSLTTGQKLSVLGEVHEQLAIRAVYRDWHLPAEKRKQRAYQVEHLPTGRRLSVVQKLAQARALVRELLEVMNWNFTDLNPLAGQPDLAARIKQSMAAYPQVPFRDLYR